MLNTWRDLRVWHHTVLFPSFPSSPLRCRLLQFNMSGTHVFAGAHHFDLSGSTVHAASTVGETAIRYTHRAR